MTVHELNRSLSKSSRTLLASSPVQHRYNPLRPLCLLINALAIVVFPGPPSINILGFFLKYLDCQSVTNPKLREAKLVNIYNDLQLMEQVSLQ